MGQLRKNIEDKVSALVAECLAARKAKQTSAEATDEGKTVEPAPESAPEVPEVAAQGVTSEEQDGRDTEAPEPSTTEPPRAAAAEAGEV